ncbi:hypothetical protein [Nocardiopsis sp. FR26]|uniref:hypothetical protein n=1 Tax=Nocardiopsis sp. FR26 TaxID=2605987 RepID=UPI00135AE84B|nr:hypothetical protein [Nocardiopsis sp. FR26]
MTLSELAAAINKALAARPDMGRMEVATTTYSLFGPQEPTPLGTLVGIHMDGDTAVIVHRSTP